MIKIAPSILAADVLNLERDVQRMVEAGCDWIHVDVMDAHFVPNLAYTPDVVKALKKRFEIPLDVHLMMDRPDVYADAFLDAGADVLCFHREAEGCSHELLRKIRERGRLAALAVKPGTPASTLEGWLEETDMVLTMTVEPGFGGQKFNEAIPAKIREIREMGYTGLIEADGGVNEKNLPMLAEHGLTVAVMGTALFRSENLKETIDRLHRI